MNRRRFLSWAVVLAAIPLCLWLGCAWWQPSDDGPGVVVAEPTQVLDGVEPGTEHEVNFVLQNRTSRAIRIVGATFG